MRWVGRRVAERRRAMELTQEVLAEHLEVTVKYLQRLEAGRENLSVRSMVTLANALGVAPSSLLRPPIRLARPRPGRPRSTSRRRS